MNTDRVVKLSALVGLGLLAVGGVMYYRRQKGLAGHGLRGRLVTGRAAQAALVGSFNDGEMKTELRADRDMPIEQRLATLQDLVHKSVQDPKMRQLALAITSKCPERDGLCEAKAIYQAVKARVRYTGDIAPIKQGSKGPVEGIDLYQSAFRTWQFKGGDCLPLSTLVLRDDYELVPLAALDPGDRIMGDGDWTTIQDRWLTGDKELLAIDLSNGCTLRCTPDHRLFRNVNGRVEEVRASEIRFGDDLMAPESIPTSSQLDKQWPDVILPLTAEERAWLLGVFVADGWADGKNTKDGWHPYRVGISGKDGQVKEEQKRRVETLMAKIGVATRWHDKYIAINDSSLARFFATCGHTAPNKRLNSLQMGEQGTRALLEGLSADADRRSGVFGTTSPQLALQLRVLHRMVGQSVHIKRVNDHGGLGKHAIYRVTPRAIENNRRDIKFARVRAISDGGIELCADLTTDTGKFWLPEADVLVHNCDDQSVLVATLLALNGIEPRLRVTSETKMGDWSHIYPIALLPKGSSNGKAVVLDTTLPGNSRFGVEVPYARSLDFPA